MSEIILIQPESSKQSKALVKLLKAFGIKFELKQEEEIGYDEAFVKTILEGQKEIESGKGVKVAIEDLWK